MRKHAESHAAQLRLLLGAPPRTKCSGLLALVVLLAGPATWFGHSQAGEPSAVGQDSVTSTQRGLAAPAGQTCRFQSARAAGDCDYVEGLLEVGGEVEEVVDDKPTRLKMSVVCRFAYHERTTQAPGGDESVCRSVRHYQRLETVIKVGDDGVKPTLRPERQLIGVEAAGKQLSVFSPQGPLTADELELVDILCNSLLLDRLLPDGPVAVGQGWKVDEALLAALLGLDEVSEADVESILTEVDQAVARFQMAGRVLGKVEGVEAEIELKSKYRFDLRRQRVDWIGLLVREMRGPGHVSRGFDAVARLQMTIRPSQTPAELADAALQGLTLEPVPELLLLSYKSAESGGWQLMHDRRWHVISEQSGLVILRMVRDGQLIAQCNISPVPAQPGTKEFTLAGFQADVRRALGENFGQFVSAKQYVNDASLRVYRVIAQGEVSELPIEWRYYLVTEESGRQMVFAFTVEQSLAAQLTPSDQQMVDSLRFSSPKPVDAASEPSGRRRLQ